MSGLDIHLLCQARSFVPRRALTPVFELLAWHLFDLAGLDLETFVRWLSELLRASAQLLLVVAQRPEGVCLDHARASFLRGRRQIAVHGVQVFVVGLHGLVGFLLLEPALVQPWEVVLVAGSRGLASEGHVRVGVGLEFAVHVAERSIIGGVTQVGLARLSLHACVHLFLCRLEVS